MEAEGKRESDTGQKLWLGMEFCMVYMGCLMTGQEGRTYGQLEAGVMHKHIIF